MVYITGDTHGELQRFTETWMPGISTWTKDDTLMICGDFSFLLEDNAKEVWTLDQMQNFPFEILFVDGNHENFPKLETFPQEKRYGGRVNRIRNNVFWLRRGELYTVQGHTFWVFGGAYSLDKAFRVAYQRLCGTKVWFEEELPIGEEYDRGSASLQACDFAPDYILTHTAPASVIFRILRQMPDEHDAELTGYLEWVYGKCRDRIKHWYFGHLHLDQPVTDKATACYTQVHTLPARNEGKENAFV